MCFVRFFNFLSLSFVQIIVKRYALMIINTSTGTPFAHHLFWASACSKRCRHRRKRRREASNCARAKHFKWIFRVFHFLRYGPVVIVIRLEALSACYLIFENKKKKCCNQSGAAYAPFYDTIFFRLASFMAFSMHKWGIGCCSENISFFWFRNWFGI